MFQVIKIQDSVRVEPDQLGRPLPDATKAALTKTFVDKVVPSVGLVVTVYDILDISGGDIYPSDGAAIFDVQFRLVVFLPFVGEVIIGRLVKSTSEGLHVSLGFFSDILIPKYALPQPATFDTNDQLWVWDFDGNDMWFDVEEEIRFRVQSVKFHLVPTRMDMQKAADAAVPVVGTAEKPYAPMTLVGDVNDSGLGLVNWWLDDEQEADGDGGG